MNQQIVPQEQNQPQGQIQPLMVQAMWFSTVATAIMGIAMVVDVISRVVGTVREAREIEKR